MFSYIPAFFSLFKRRPTLDDSASLLLSPIGITETMFFLCLYTSWASLDANPESVLSDIDVVCLMHNKRSESSESDDEFLVIETVDRRNVVRLFILERIASGCSLANLNSDNITLSSHDIPIDRFLGQDFVYKKGWQGENMRYIIPNRLSLFDLALLANVVHMLHPEYLHFKDQSYFYADLVYASIKEHFGVRYSEDANEKESRLVFVDGSCLSGKYGRWNGVMINRTEPEEVSLVISTFKEVRTQEVSKVNL